jgi:hypothetical protein
MSTFTFDSKDPKGLLCVLGEASIEFDNMGATASKALLDELRDQLRAQVKPAIEEPQEFGSIVQAWHPSESPSGTPPDLWQRSPVNGKHYWENRNGVIEVWSDLQYPEVLRVGIGEQSDEGWRRGWDALRAKLRRHYTQIASSAITAERKDAWRQALEALEEM